MIVYEGLGQTLHLMCLLPGNVDLRLFYMKLFLEVFVVAVVGFLDLLASSVVWSLFSCAFSGVIGAKVWLLLVSSLFSFAFE